MWRTRDSPCPLPFVLCTTYSGIVEELGRRQLKGTFSRYLSDEMVAQVLA